MGFTEGKDQAVKYLGERFSYRIEREKRNSIAKQENKKKNLTSIQEEVRTVLF